MRRAVAACTSPELFFGRRDATGGASDVRAIGGDFDPVGLAMDSAMASLNMDLGGTQI